MGPQGDLRPDQGLLGARTCRSWWTSPRTRCSRPQAGRHLHDVQRQTGRARAWNALLGQQGDRRDRAGHRPKDGSQGRGGEYHRQGRGAHLRNGLDEPVRSPMGSEAGRQGYPAVGPHPRQARAVVAAQSHGLFAAKRTSTVTAAAAPGSAAAAAGHRRRCTGPDWWAGPNTPTGVSARRSGSYARHRGPSRHGWRTGVPRTTRRSPK